MCGLKIVEGGISEVAPLLSMDLLSLTMIIRGSAKTKDSESEVINFEEELEVKVATHWKFSTSTFVSVELPAARGCGVDSAANRELPTALGPNPFMN
ncbi:hypothetical protein WN943_008191 [Citrus x changshan-huyou]